MLLKNAKDLELEFRILRFINHLEILLVFHEPTADKQLRVIDRAASCAADRIVREDHHAQVEQAVRADAPNNGGHPFARPPVQPGLRPVRLVSDLDDRARGRRKICAYLRRGIRTENICGLIR